MVERFSHKRFVELIGGEEAGMRLLAPRLVSRLVSDN